MYSFILQSIYSTFLEQKYEKFTLMFGILIGIINGAEEDRTPDPLLAKQVLSQLSYSPSYSIVAPPACPAYGISLNAPSALI